MKKLLFISMLILTLSASAQHFTKIWEGNGTGHMNIYITSGTIDGQTIAPGDEIAIYSGEKCVGFGIVESDYIHKEYILCDVITSMDDGTGNGFTENSPITVKIWDSSASKMPEIIDISYFNTLDFWTTDGTFSQGGSAFIQLEANNVYKKKVLLKSGLNTLEISYNLLSTSLPVFFEELILGAKLNKVQNNKGQSFERINETNWINSIGEINASDTYTVYVNQDCEFEYQGILK